MIRALLEGTQEMFMLSIMNLLDMHYNSYGEILSISVSVIFAFGYFMLPVIGTHMLVRNFNRIGEPKIMNKYSSFYLNIKTHSLMACMYSNIFVA